MDTISVIIPTWNREGSIGKAVRSALDQTLPPIEILVCDDGSSDATAQIVNAIDDRRVKWLPGMRGGRPAIPRNRGLHESRGDWIAFLDDDDEWLPGKLAAQIDLAKKKNCLASCSNAFSGIYNSEPSLYNLGWSGETLTFYDLLYGNRVICSSALIHSSLSREVQGFPESPALVAVEDYAFWLRVAAITNFAFVKEPLVRYSDSPGTSIRAKNDDPWSMKRKVILNFLVWGCRTKINLDYLKPAFQNYCVAMMISAKNELADIKNRAFHSQ